MILDQFVTLTPHWVSCQTAGSSVFRVHISLPCISAKITPIDSLLPSNLLSLAHPKDTPPFHPHLLQISIHCPGTLVLSCLSPHLFLFSPPSHFLSALLSSSLSSICLIWLLYSPFWVRFNHAPLGLPSCFASFGLWRAVWISYTLWLIFTCKWEQTCLSFCVWVISVCVIDSSCIFA